MTTGAICNIHIYIYRVMHHKGSIYISKGLRGLQTLLVVDVSFEWKVLNNYHMKIVPIFPALFFQFGAETIETSISIFT